MDEYQEPPRSQFPAPQVEQVNPVDAQKIGFDLLPVLLQEPREGIQFPRLRDSKTSLRNSAISSALIRPFWRRRWAFTSS